MTKNQNLGKYKDLLTLLSFESPVTSHQWGLNKDTVDDEEVAAMEAILGYRAKHGMTVLIKVPKVN